MAPLHKINPLRLTYIRDAACRKFERNVKSLNCLSGLRILDIGCGAGLLCEPFTRLGAQVIGVDPSASNIAAAKLHADKGHLSIDYRCTTVEEMDVRERFDIVLAMEVVEHVSDVGVFLNRCAAMLKPGGMMVVSTLNRNWKSFALAIVGAEYVLRWLPRGTHQWDKFVTPDELAHHLHRQQTGHHRADRRGLQPVRRPLEPVLRHGRELHGGGEGDGVTHQGARRRPPQARGQRWRGVACHAIRQVDPSGLRPHGDGENSQAYRIPACSASPRSGYPSPSPPRWARWRATRCSGS